VQANQLPIKTHLGNLLKRISETPQPLLIKQNSEARLVLMDVNIYEEFDSAEIYSFGKRGN
jgi:PHD/YefM family antitoxin component YafN of YafNO toxin-antitoxin module